MGLRPSREPEPSITAWLALRTAQWWADWLRNGNADVSVGDDSHFGVITELELSLAYDAIHQSGLLMPALINVFEATLAEQTLGRLRSNTTGVIIKTDYDPDLQLQLVAHQVGIPLELLILPTRAISWTYPDHIVTLARGSWVHYRPTYPDGMVVLPGE